MTLIVADGSLVAGQMRPIFIRAIREIRG